MSRLAPRKNYHIPILEALQDAGGVSTRNDISLRLIGKMTFNQGDLESRLDGYPKLVRAVGYVIGDLRKDGLIEPETNNGVVRISDKGRQCLSENRKG